MVELPDIVFERRARTMHGDGLPTVMPDASMSEHLVILRRLLGWGIRVFEAVAKAYALDRLLWHALVDIGGFDADTFENRGQEIRDMVVLIASCSGIADAVWPVHDERVTYAALVGVLFVETQRRIADLGPARGVVVVQVGSTDFVDTIHHVFRTATDQIEEPEFVQRAVFASLLARAVIGDQHDDRVVEHIELFEEVDQPADLVIGVI